jgi:sterol desaturase/sphingolipid hydroxylase (fatty acid hydroxylase superfamily)
VIGIPIGLAWSNAAEWVLHKYVLHGLGRRKGNFFAFHWEHHREVRRNGFRDPGYQHSLLAWNPQSKELLGLIALGATHAPLLPVFPFFTLTVWWRTVAYWRTHKRAHMDPEWARKNLPWHWDHHMGTNPNTNWCVTNPWFDNLMGTRVPSAADDPVGGPAPSPAA